MCIPSVNYNSKNPYKVLGVSSNASKEKIRKAYKNLARYYHPDKHSNAKWANEAFRNIKEAYNKLTDPDHPEYFKSRSYSTSSSKSSSDSHPFHSAWGSSSSKSPSSEPFHSAWGSSPSKSSSGASSYSSHVNFSTNSGYSTDYGLSYKRASRREIDLNEAPSFEKRKVKVGFFKSAEKTFMKINGEEFEIISARSNIDMIVHGTGPYQAENHASLLKDNKDPSLLDLDPKETDYKISYFNFKNPTKDWGSPRDLFYEVIMPKESFTRVSRSLNF